MVAVPRIERVGPSGTITRPEEGLPVIARLRWPHGIMDVPAIAIAWCRVSVEVRWVEIPGEPLRTDWIAAGDVRRTIDEPPPDPTRPPSRRSQQRLRQLSQ